MLRLEEYETKSIYLYISWSIWIYIIHHSSHALWWLGGIVVEVSVSWLQAFIQALSSTAVFPQGSSFFTIYKYYIQGFPQVLRTWERLKSIHGGGGGKCCQKVPVMEFIWIVQLPAISLQACKFTKNKLLHISSSRILARF